jgi:prepilin-type N-terminal cleavage/methylation domain-containing protein
MKRNSRGFSLIELLIVVAIILIIAAIAIPNLLRSRIAANQASAVGSLRTLNTSVITYASTYNGGYAAFMSYLGPGAGGNPTAQQAGLIDSVLSGSGGNTSAKSGYNFGYTPGATDASGRINTYAFTAAPITAGTTGTNYYFTDQSGVIRQNSTAQASASDSPIAG